MADFSCVFRIVNNTGRLLRPINEDASEGYFIRGLNIAIESGLTWDVQLKDRWSWIPWVAPSFVQ